MTNYRSLILSAVANGLTVTANDALPAESAVAIDCPTETNRDKTGTKPGQQGSP